ncbi:transcriptional regulator [Mycobacterium intracellulare]|uniref:helix-turn-helix transcriptional regulator n=1 Tax=Mycobacterium intracellulare TaxID=1767 RepID=UPI0007EA2C65|nr:helix-turn-helix transcriptional regulator [Mycobacterium intracellulare]OBH35145.1 transcriptional regulator [Mycobacterium intracellulare]OBH73910.1 transcriptional regulator [Mycobacterium intracellulare]
MPDRQPLAAFLRARRERLRPADVGLAGGGRRRVAGLRREEVAMLAGISADYYLRLEQGRTSQPSDQVLAALARALQLNDDATEYMRNLARPALTRRSRAAASAEKVDLGLRTLIDNWQLIPAYVQDRHMNVLAANSMAQALLPYFAPGFNQLRTAFLDPDFPAWVDNWDEVTDMLVSWLRFNIAEDNPTDPELQSLIDELSDASQRFRTLWARQEVKQKTSGPAPFQNPRVGPLALCYRVFMLPDTKQTMIAYYAEPGTPSEERLRKLSGLVHSP